MKYLAPLIRELGNLSENFSHNFIFFGTMEKIFVSVFVSLIYDKRWYILQSVPVL